MKRGQEADNPLVVSDSDEDMPLAARVVPGLKLAKTEWKAPEGEEMRNANKEMSKCKWVKSYFKQSLTKASLYKCALCVDDANARTQFKDSRGNNTHTMEAHLKSTHELTYEAYEQSRVTVNQVSIHTHLWSAAEQQRRQKESENEIDDDDAGAPRRAALKHGKAAALFVRHGVPHSITRDPDWKELFNIKPGFALPRSQRDLKNAIIGEAAMITKANRDSFGSDPITIAVDGGKTNKLKTVAIAAYCRGRGTPLAVVEKKANDSESDNEDDDAVQSPDSAKAQARVIADALAEAKLQNPIVAIVSDNAANIVAACAQLVGEGIANELSF